jgi:hypothetical protein
MASSAPAYEHNASSFEQTLSTLKQQSVQPGTHKRKHDDFLANFTPLLPQCSSGTC